MCTLPGKWNSTAAMTAPSFSQHCVLVHECLNMYCTVHTCYKYIALNKIKRQHGCNGMSRGGDETAGGWKEITETQQARGGEMARLGC